MIGQTLQIKKNHFFIEKNRRKKFSNSIIMFFLIMQSIFGFNFGFIDVLNKKIRNFYKVISLVMCLCTGVLFLLNTPVFVTEWDMRILWGSLYFGQHCGHVVLLYFSKYKVYNFMTDIRSIDSGIIYSKEYKIGLFTCILFGWFFLITIISSAVCIVANLGCLLDNHRINAIYMMGLTGLESIVLVQLIVNFYAYYAVIYLVGLVEKEKTSFIRKQFLRVSETCEKFGGYYENLALIELFTHLPKYLTLICNFIYHVNKNEIESTYLTRLAYSLYVIFQMCAPAVSVEVVNKQMENLRFKLYSRLMEEKDVEKHLELSNLLRYMEQKPLFNKMWRVIPTDINLVVALFSFVTTYVIVVMQFMHIY